MFHNYHQTYFPAHSVNAYKIWSISYTVPYERRTTQKHFYQSMFSKYIYLLITGNKHKPDTPEVLLRRNGRTGLREITYLQHKNTLIRMNIKCHVQYGPHVSAQNITTNTSFVSKEIQR
jgi:hypothetical protein